MGQVPSQFPLGNPHESLSPFEKHREKDTIGAVLSVILLIFCGWWVIAVIDFVTIALKDKIYWFDFNEMKLYALEDSTDSADNNSNADKPSSDDNNSNADKID